MNEPGQRILVHGFDVRQIRDTKEQDGGVLSDRFITISSIVNLLLGGHSKFLKARKAINS